MDILRNLRIVKDAATTLTKSDGRLQQQLLTKRRRMS